MNEHIQDSENWVDQPIHSSIAASHAIRAIVMAVVMLVLGLWGVYDYGWGIPEQEEAFQRGEISRNVLASLGAIAAGEDTQLVPNTVRYIDVLIAEHSSLSSDEEGQTRWDATLATYRNGIEPPSNVSPTDWPSLRMQAQTAAEESLRVYDDVTQPSKYDKPVQWLFIICLPFVPFYLWSFLKTRNQNYLIEVDGTLHMPEGVWKSDEIADIDMKRWMAKSICWVVSSDSTRIKLDAHIHKNLDRIIGVIAHRLHPNEWSLDARPVVADKNEEPSPVEKD